MGKQVVVVAFLALIQSAISEESRSSRFKSIQAHIAPAKSRIIGGEEAVPHSFPSDVGLRINGNAFCGGVLISPNYVLTAGHCGIVIFVVDVILGAHNISDANEPTQVTIRGSNVIVHEGYDDETLRNDITLVQLSVPAPINQYIQPAKLPPRSDVSRTYLNDVATATGWGLYQDVPFPSTRDMSDVLLQVDVSVSNLTECADYYNDEDGQYVVSTNLCTSGYRNKGTCNGDSGGPLTVDGVLIAITSFGTDLCEACAPSVYTRVVDYLDWIAANSDVVV